jgi:hypothetical protein
MQKTDIKKPPRNRMIVGGFVFILGIICPVFIPLVVVSGLPVGLISIISGLLAIGIPELLMIIAAAILGKPGFNYLKHWFRVMFRRYGPPGQVSRIRYTFGLVLFIFPLAIGLLMPYLMKEVHFFDEHYLMFTISGNVMLLMSLFVLGGDFWDKLRGLFIREAKINLPANSKDKILH